MLASKVKNATERVSQYCISEEIKEHTKYLLAPFVPSLPCFDYNSARHVQLRRAMRQVSLSTSTIRQSVIPSKNTNVDVRFIFTNKNASPNKKLLNGLIPGIFKGVQHIGLRGRYQRCTKQL